MFDLRQCAKAADRIELTSVVLRKTGEARSASDQSDAPAYPRNATGRAVAVAFERPREASGPQGQRVWLFTFRKGHRRCRFRTLK